MQTDIEQHIVKSKIVHEIQNSLLTAAGISDKAKNHLKDEDKTEAIKGVSSIDNAGSFDDINSKVKYGTFFDNTARTLTYQITPRLQPLQAHMHLQAQPHLTAL